MAQRTVWDRDLFGPGTETVWDRDLFGPGTETFWDVLPDVLGRIVKIKWQSVVRRAAWLSPARRVKW